MGQIPSSNISGTLKIQVKMEESQNLILMLPLPGLKELLAKISPQPLWMMESTICIPISSTTITQEPVMTSAAMTHIPTPDTLMTGLTAMEPGVLGRYQEPATMTMIPGMASQNGHL